ncbi:unnamed protein product [Cyprideis torosa]|uniref:Uncharacterized protein n=1 Tax=Cyprideis torosa TaxID=163714 RepID=A0A7R8WFT4_9CRUS|nr:unnamed protein product [Cyprideis torosa]CAG0897285.1 unnamed protein product [Cyprideis torosa]
MYTNNNLDEEEDEKSRLKPSATDSPLVTTYKSQIWDFKRKIQSYEEALRQRDECISQLRSQIVDGDEGDYDAAVSNIRLGMQRSREQVRTAISDRDYAESVAAASKEQLKHGEAAWKESEDNLRRQTVPLDEYEGRLKDVREEYNDKITKIR